MHDIFSQSYIFNTLLGEHGRITISNDLVSSIFSLWNSILHTSLFSFIFSVTYVSNRIFIAYY